MSRSASANKHLEKTTFCWFPRELGGLFLGAAGYNPQSFDKIQSSFPVFPGINESGFRDFPIFITLILLLVVRMVNKPWDLLSSGTIAIPR